MLGVLIVDDEEITREGLATRIAWKENGLTVCGTASTALDALELMERSIPDILILDIRMPEMDGIELLKIVHHNYPGVRVILISGYDDFEYAQEAVNSRAFSFILKPIDEELLLSHALCARDEIEAEKKHLEEDAQLRSRYEAWLPTVRNNLICRLVRGGPAIGQEHIDEAHALGLELTEEWFRVILFQIRESSASRSAGSGHRFYREYAVLDRAVELWTLPATAHGFDCGDQAGLLVIGRSDTEAVRADMDRLRTWANQKAALAMTIGVGWEVKGLEKLQESYGSASRALAARIVAGRNTVIVADGVMLTRTAHNATLELQGVLDSVEAKTVNSIQSNDTAAATSMVETVVGEVRRLMEHCIEAKSRLLHQVVAFLMKIRFALDLDVPSYGVFACTEVESIEELEETVTRFLTETLREWQQKQNTHNNRIVKRAIEHLHRNVRNDISLTRVADAMGVHPNYLSSIFRAEVGKRFIDYEREVKIDEAKRLLRETPMKVYEIAASIHYQDVNHFTRMFKKLVGCSPSEYRELQ